MDIQEQIRKAEELNKLAELYKSSKNSSVKSNGNIAQKVVSSCKFLLPCGRCEKRGAPCDYYKTGV